MVLLSDVILFQRKQEKEIALYGRVLSSDNADGEDVENDGDEMETDDLPEPGETIDQILVTALAMLPLYNHDFLSYYS